MIDKKEYRLNNLVWVKVHNTYDRITNIDLDDDYVGMSMLNRNCHIDMLHPIGLSPEWLEKCGFELSDEEPYNSEGGQGKLWTGLIRINQKEDNFWLWISIEDDLWYSFQWTKIEYIHQLQNLTHALTGTELVINH